MISDLTPLQKLVFAKIVSVEIEKIKRQIPWLTRRGEKLANRYIQDLERQLRALKGMQ